MITGCTVKSTNYEVEYGEQIKVQVNLSVFFIKQNAKNMYVDSELCQKTDVKRKKPRKFHWKISCEGSSRTTETEFLSA
jgi:ribosomal protein L24E